MNNAEILYNQIDSILIDNFNLSIISIKMSLDITTLIIRNIKENQTKIGKTYLTYGILQTRNIVDTTNIK